MGKLGRFGGSDRETRFRFGTGEGVGRTGNGLAEDVRELQSPSPEGQPALRHQIKSGEISAKDTVSTSASTYSHTTNGSWEDIDDLEKTITVVEDNVQILIYAVCACRHSNATETNRVGSVRVLRDTADVIGEASVVTMSTQDKLISIPIAQIDAPTSGTYTYKIQSFTDNTTFTIENRTMLVVQIKR